MLATSAALHHQCCSLQPKEQLQICFQTNWWGSPPISVVLLCNLAKEVVFVMTVHFEDTEGRFPGNFAPEHSCHWTFVIPVMRYAQDTKLLP